MKGFIELKDVMQRLICIAVEEIKYFSPRNGSGGGTFVNLKDGTLIETYEYYETIKVKIRGAQD